MLRFILDGEGLVAAGRWIGTGAGVATVWRWLAGAWEGCPSSVVLMGPLVGPTLLAPDKEDIPLMTAGAGETTGLGLDTGEGAAGIVDEGNNLVKSLFTAASLLVSLVGGLVRLLLSALGDHGKSPCRSGGRGFLLLPGGSCRGRFSGDFILMSSSLLPRKLLRYRSFSVEKNKQTNENMHYAI